MTRTTIDNTESVLDSRDIIERIEELEAERENYTTQNAEHGVTPEMIDALHAAWAVANPEDAAELATLHKVARQAEGYCEDWRHGATLIRDDYFVEYARELVTDCGYISAEMPWWIKIDWAATAENISIDYTSVDFDGVTYWIR